MCWNICTYPIWLKSDLYLRYSIEDPITFHYRSWSNELSSLDIASWFGPIRSRNLTAVQYFKDDGIYVFVSPRTCSLLRFKRSKGQSFRNTFRHTKFRFYWSISLSLNTSSNGELSDPLCDRGLTLVRLKMATRLVFGDRSTKKHYHCALPRDVIIVRLCVWVW